MGGADLKDQILHSYLIERKRMNKWYMKIFCRLLNTSILNAMIIYRNNTRKRIDQLSFRIQLVEGMFVKYANVLERKVPGQHSSDNTVPQLTERHFISKLPPTEKEARPQRRCVVCQKHGKRKDTVYWCDACDVGLCVECFQDYHTKLNFQGSKILFLRNSKFTVPKLMLKYTVVDIPIPCTSQNIMLKLQGKKNYFFQIYCYSNEVLHFLALIFKHPLSPGISKN
jgi:hypothetical protein